MLPGSARSLVRKYKKVMGSGSKVWGKVVCNVDVSAAEVLAHTNAYLSCYRLEQHVNIEGGLPRYAYQVPRSRSLLGHSGKHLPAPLDNRYFEFWQTWDDLVIGGGRAAQPRFCPASVQKHRRSRADTGTRARHKRQTKASSAHETHTVDGGPQRDRSSTITRPSQLTSHPSTLVTPSAGASGPQASLAGSPPRSSAHAARSSRSTAHGPTAVHLVHGGRNEWRVVRRVPARDAALMPNELKACKPHPSVADRRREADLLAHDGNHVGTCLRDRAGAQRPPLSLSRRR